MRLLALILGAICLAQAARAAERPNVVLIMTDDQGWGDFGFHGNPKIKTPHLDALAAQGAELTQFCVSPVCAPTRASLMTGRYNYRTGAVDTFKGRAMMRGEETTLAEALVAAGYRTGIFGKWHLGDNYPLRPMDQGFEESLVLRGGGIGQASDPIGGESYFDTVLERNGRQEKTRGYCSDVIADAAIDFVERRKDEPFFLYLAFNCPHTPLEVAEKDYLPYKETNLAGGAFPAVGHPPDAKLDPDTVAKIYGMITNIDDNVGRLMARLEGLGLGNRTLVIFLTDNGPQQARFNGGLRGAKGTVYEGGIRTPCLVRWPGHVEPGRRIDRIAAHIDIAPTVLEACGAAAPDGAAFDGRSLWPLLSGATDAAHWPDRTLFFQWHRGDVPQARRCFAARSQRWKLLAAEGAHIDGPAKPATSFELFDIAQDPYEMKDRSKEKPEIAEKLLADYDAWFADVSSQGFDPPRIVLGTDEENPAELNVNDMRGPDSGHSPKSRGWWEVEIAREGVYEIGLVFWGSKEPFAARAKIGGADLAENLAGGAARATFKPIKLAKGPARLEAWTESAGAKRGVRFVEIRRVE